MAFNGQLTNIATLTKSQLHSWLYAQIISIMTFTDNVGTSFDSLVNKFRVDGSRYGDQKQYISLELPNATDFVPDSEDDLNVLKVNRLQGTIEAVKLDTFKKLFCTTDSYITPLAFGEDGAFSQFNSAMVSTLREAMRVYDGLTFSCIVGTTEATTGAGQQQEIELDGDETPQEFTLKVAKKIADIKEDLKYPSTEFNDLGYLRSYNPEDFVTVAVSEVATQMLWEALPVTYHKDGLADFDYTLPARFFGDLKTSNGTSDGTVRTAIAMSYTSGGKVYNLNAGDLIPSGITYKANEAYAPNEDIICKFVHKNALPYMSALEMGTEWVNPSNGNSVTHYLYFARGCNRITGVPVITLRKKA